MLLSKANLEKVIEDIVQLDSFADVEELTFPMNEPTAERQQEWLDEFMNRFETHIRGVLEEYTEPTLKVYKPEEPVQIMKVQIRVNKTLREITESSMSEQGYRLIDQYDSLERGYSFQEYVLNSENYFVGDKKGE